MPRRKKRVMRKEHVVHLIILPVTILLFLSLLVVQHRRITILNGETANLTFQLKELEAQNRFYRKAYEITLDDMRAISEAYNTTARYDRLAGELRQQELAGLNASENFTLRNPGLWRTFKEQGTIDTSCLNESTTVDTVGEEVLVRLHANGTYALYLDGEFLTQADGAIAFTVPLQKGEHELDLVAREGNVSLAAAMFDLQEYPLKRVVADKGLLWEVFDCIGSGYSPSILEPGALRLGFVKE